MSVSEERSDPDPLEQGVSGETRDLPESPASPTSPRQVTVCHRPTGRSEADCFRIVGPFHPPGSVGVLERGVTVTIELDRDAGRIGKDGERSGKRSDLGQLGDPRRLER